MNEGSPIAYAALAVWPIITLLLFARLKASSALTWTLLLGGLFLPASLEVDYPLIPPLHRSSISCLAALVGCAVFNGRRIWAVPPGRGLEAFIWVLVFGAFATARTNPDPIGFSEVYLPGMSLYDGLSLAIDVFFSIWIPFYLGRCLFRHPRQLVPLFRAIVVAMLVYSAFILVELRVSPQFHRWVYGYHQHQFAQTLRGGGYRPMVFMSHGLAVAQFVAFGTVAAAALWKARRRVGAMPAAPLAMYLGAILAAMKSLGAAIYGVITVAAITMFRPRWQLRIAAVLGVLVLLYPISRATDVFPREALLNAAASVSEDRRQSLEFRFFHEEMLLERARERISFGWGLFGRGRVRDETGRDISVTDGYWIIALGTMGAPGFLATFLLVLAPVFVTMRRIRLFGSRRNQRLVAALAWLVTVSAVNLIPNAELSPFILMMAGALAGVLEGLPARRKRKRRRAIDEAGAFDEGPAQEPLSLVERRATF